MMKIIGCGMAEEEKRRRRRNSKHINEESIARSLIAYLARVASAALASLSIVW